MASGAALIGVGTLLFDAGVIPPMAWMILVGLGLYLGYVPYGCVLFDAVAHGGSVGIVLYKTLGQASISKLQFFRYFSYTTCVGCVVLLVASARYFLLQAVTSPQR